jgi:hypothetical protein
VTFLKPYHAGGRGSASGQPCCYPWPKQEEGKENGGKAGLDPGGGPATSVIWLLEDILPTALYCQHWLSETVFFRHRTSSFLCNSFEPLAPCKIKQSSKSFHRSAKKLLDHELPQRKYRIKKLFRNKYSIYRETVLSMILQYSWPTLMSPLLIDFFLLCLPSLNLLYAFPALDMMTCKYFCLPSITNTCTSRDSSFEASYTVKKSLSNSNVGSGGTVPNDTAEK